MDFVTKQPRSSRPKRILSTGATIGWRNGNAWRCWLAESRGRFLGNIWVHLIEKIPNPVAEAERHAYITSFYVIPEMRGRQVGRKLLRTALTWCERNEVDATILWPSKRSRSLYLKYGFVRADDMLERRGRD